MTCPPAVFSDYYLGKPGALAKLTLPDSGVTVAIGRNESNAGPVNGGVTTIRSASVRRVWGLSMSQLTPDAAETLISFYTGGRGAGPYCLLDPTFRNQLGRDSSTMGAASGKPAWAAYATDAQPYVDATFAPPLLGSAVLRWTTPATGKSLVAEATQPTAGVTGIVPTSTRAVPAVPDQDAAVSVYARTVSGTASASAAAYAASLTAGTTSLLGAATTLTTSWQRLSVAIPAGTSGFVTAAYLLAGLQMRATSSVDVLVACAQTELGTQIPRGWVTGLGVPRVTISAPLSGSSSIAWRRTHGVTLSEV